MRGGRIVPALLIAAGLSIDGAGQQATFQRRTDLVPVNVSVLNGRVPVAGLTAADFLVLDAGERQRLEGVQIDDVPVDVSLVIDVSNSTEPAIESFARDVRLMADQLRPVDRIRIVTFGGDIREMVPSQSAGTALRVEPLTPAGSTPLNDALLYALARPVAPGWRHLVVIFTDGDDSSSTLAPEAIPGLASRADAVLHAVLSRPGLRNLIGDPAPWPPASLTALKDAASRTGGDIHALGGAVDTFKAILREFRQSYVLYFAPTDRTTGWHPLTVRVMTPGAERFTVRARAGYVRD